LGKVIFLGNLYQHFGFLAITFEPESLESQSKVHKSGVLPWSAAKT